MSRLSGLLLHPTSLPGAWGIGDLGTEAEQFVDFLVAAGQQLWQVLPLGPTGYGDSPYQGLSTFAGNPLLLSPERMLAAGWLEPGDLAAAPTFPVGAVDYPAVQGWKRGLLERAHARFGATAGSEQRVAFATFCTANAAWLDDYTLFMAVKEAHGNESWSTWPRPIRQRTPAAVKTWRTQLAGAIDYHAFTQYLFFEQWATLRAYAHARGVRIVGDLPIFVAYDSADVWARRDLFMLDKEGEMLAVAGVPPDLFTADGQRWGNVLYRWDVLAAQGYSWWVERLRALCTLVDVVRIDHFRGFAAYWEVPASEPTARNGKWVDGPGLELFNALEAALGLLPIIAEDLGFITPDVITLRDTLGFPGMKVLQMAWSGDPADIYLPHNYPSHSVVYTATHDNNTTTGWWATALPSERFHAQVYLGRDGSDVSWDMIRLALASVATWAVLPLQDVLALGAEGRMNTPGLASGNWTWRIPPGALTPTHATRLNLLTTLYGRAPVVVAPADDTADNVTANAADVVGVPLIV